MCAGIYGMLHDEITYSICPEYFTRVKFPQFNYLNLQLSPRIFVGEIGFLAAAAVGFIAIWFLARIAVPAWPKKLAIRRITQAASLVLAASFITGSIGCWIGMHYGSSN